MTSRVRRRSVLALAALLWLARPVSATVLIPTDLRDLSRDASTIVRGRVASVTARWTDDRRGVETLVTLAVEAALKGTSGDVITFRVPGGRLGRLRSLVLGAPQFADGDHVIVFLGNRGPSVPHVIGLGQGVYRVVAQRTGSIVTPPVLVGTGFARPVARGDRDRRPLPLAAFEQQVSLLAGEGR